MAVVKALALLAAAEFAFANAQYGGPDKDADGDRGYGGDTNYGGPSGGRGGSSSGSAQSNSGSSSSAQSSQQGGGGGMSSGGPPFTRDMVIAHAVLASLAVALFFPAGAITIRAIPSKITIWLHVAWQIAGYALFVAAVGLGIYMAKQIEFGDYKMINQYHPVIGLIVFAFLSLQPIGGILHHVGFKKYGKRTIFSHTHLWIGRIFITLGIINGGLGLRFAGGATRGQEAAYGVVAGVIWLVWMGAAVWGELKRLKRPAPPSAGSIDRPKEILETDEEAMPRKG